MTFTHGGRISSRPDQADTATVRRLQREFDQMLRWHMTAADYAAAVEANRQEPDPVACHTHDYIDANESMEAAFQNVIGRASDPAVPSDANLINRAWTQWKRGGGI